jgi:hypothetical protein
MANSVAKWLAHLPFTSKVAGSNLSENFLNATRIQSSCEKSEKVNALPKVVGFLRVLRFPPTGKVDRVGYSKRARSNWHMLLC